MNRKRISKLILAGSLCVSLMLGVIPPAFGAEAEEHSAVTLKEGSYSPGEVIVLFQEGAVTDKRGLLQASSSSLHLGAFYGESLQAAGAAKEAAKVAGSEADILRKSLGDDYVLEDTLLFPDRTESIAEKPGKLKAGLPVSSVGGLAVSLVSSETYSTEELMEKLSKNSLIAAVEPNSLIVPDEFCDYSLNDPYSSFLYHENSPLAENKGGNRVDSRGRDPQVIPSVNAANGWQALSGGEEESVVAVIDSGVLVTHEDLKDRMWTNPGNIGLEGEHGYNFVEGNGDPHDESGHGTHCAGVIAAQANNGKGVAGITGEANVKIMALKVLTNKSASYLYNCYGAFCYVLRAKQAGVNVTVTSNSWGLGTARSQIYESIIDQLGENGIITFLSSGNEAADNDHIPRFPTELESEYTVVVGAADMEQKPANFSNYGKSSVDVFAPGVNVLSSFGRSFYFPSVYTAEELNRTTEYYGEFSAATEISQNKVTPEVGPRAGSDIKPFGESVFVKQNAPLQEGQTIPDLASCEISIDDSGRYLSKEHPNRLKITIRNAQYGEQYFFYFPYEKNPETVGDQNTRFSLVCESSKGDPDGSAGVRAGEVYEKDGRMVLGGGGVSVYGIAKVSAGLISNATNMPPEGSGSENSSGTTYLLSYEDAKEKAVGLGVQITWRDGESPWIPGDSHDLTVYIDSLGISKPFTGEEPLVDKNSSYKLSSGTSQSCPSVAGAAALLAALYPQTEGQNGADYARQIRSILFSCVRKTEALEDLCSTGGYVDLSLLGEQMPAISNAVCDVKQETLTLTGKNLQKASLSYRRLNGESGEVTLPAGGMTLDYAADGNSIVIHHAKSLFGTYTEFSARREDGKKASAKFFLVNGQDSYILAAEKMEFYGTDETKHSLSLASDAEGTKLFGYDSSTGEVVRFEDGRFCFIDGTKMIDAFKEWLISERGYDRFQLFNKMDKTNLFQGMNSLTGNDGKLYQIIRFVLDEYEGFYLAVLDLSQPSPFWNFSELPPFPDETIQKSDLEYQDHVIADGKIFFVSHGTNQTVLEDACTFFCYDIQAKTWTRKQDIPYIGQFDNKGNYYAPAAAAANGLVFMNTSVDGAGNSFLYNTETDTCEPLYYTIGSTLSVYSEFSSAAATQDGLYYIIDNDDKVRTGYSLYFLSAASGAYQSRFARLDKTSESLATGKNLTLHVVSGKAESWKSSNTKVAAVDRNGTVTAVGAGTADITVTLRDGRKIAPCKVTVTQPVRKTKIALAKTSFSYTGNAHKPKVTIKALLDGKETYLKEGTHYTVSYSKNKAVGTATVTVKGKGYYTGTVTKTFAIVPKSTVLSAVPGVFRGFTAKWKAQKTQTTGYQIQYSISKSFKSGNKTATVKKNTAVSKTITNLKAKTTYYVRVRTYKTVGGKRYYSAWSKAKAVKTK